MQTIEKLENEIRILKSSLEELTVLNDIAITSGSSLSTKEVLETIVKKSIQAVKAEQGSIKMVMEEKNQPLQTLVREDDFSIVGKSYKVGTHIIGWVLKNKTVLIIDDLATDSRFTVAEEEKKEIRTALCVPINFKGQIIGVLTVINKKTPEPFSKNDGRLLSIVAAQSGQIIRNSQLQEEALEKTRLQEELNVARKIQLSLIPDKDPKIEGLDIASFYIPADNVGGDYFDYFDLGDEKIAAVIADVSGHGPPAALMMTMIKGVFHSIMSHFSSTDQALGEINRILNRILPSEMFVTILLLEIDLKKKEMHFSNAGHNPFFFYDTKMGKVQLIEKPGFAINLLPDSTYSPEKIDLQKNDLIFVYTDGLTEAVNDKFEMFGTERIEKIINKTKEESSLTTINNIRSELTSFADAAIAGDDIAMITIKINKD